MDPAEPLTIVSGGQTGVDRAALDVAMENGLPCGGWCPRGRRAEDGPIPGRYPLRETSSPRYPERTRRNVRDTDATLVLTAGPADRGTKLTIEIAARYAKPLLQVDLDSLPDPTEVDAWIQRYRVRVLNVAGPRQSRCSGIHVRAAAFLRRIRALGAAEAPAHS